MSTYFDRWPNLAISRSTDGVLELRLHCNGGPFAFSSSARRQLLEAFQAIAGDRANRVIILTGTGDVWCEGFDSTPGTGPDPSLTAAERWDIQFSEGRRLVSAMLDVDTPMIAAVNGPARIHSEYLLTCDIILASENACFQDKPHLENGVSPTDGVHVLWPYVLGPVRGHYFLLTRQELSAQQAMDYGVVNEVLPADALMARAHALAAELAAQPPGVLRGARIGLTQRLKALVTNELALGLSLESLSVLSRS